VSGVQRVWAGLEADKESNGWLRQVSEFVEVESVDTKVGNFVYKPAIFRANTKGLRNIKIGTAAINERASRLSL